MNIIFKQRFIFFILIISLCMCFTSACYSEPNINTTTIQTTIPIPIIIETLPQDISYDKTTIIEYIETYTNKFIYANQMLTAAINLGYGENHHVVQLARQEIESALNNKTLYQNKLNEIILREEKYNTLYEIYPTATAIWFYLKDLGYNDYICAGIMGNIMAEVGGNTLNIKPYLVGGIHYGICQWNKNYCPNVWGTNLETQLNYLRDTIKSEFNTFGFVYKKNFNYQSFIQIENASDAALAFAMVYERCYHEYYNVRMTNALIAYEFFVD